MLGINKEWLNTIVNTIQYNAIHYKTVVNRIQCNTIQYEHHTVVDTIQ